MCDRKRARIVQIQKTVLNVLYDKLAPIIYKKKWIPSFYCFHIGNNFYHRLWLQLKRRYKFLKHCINQSG